MKSISCTKTANWFHSATWFASSCEGSKLWPNYLCMAILHGMSTFSSILLDLLLFWQEK